MGTWGWRESLLIPQQSSRVQHLCHFVFFSQINHWVGCAIFSVLELFCISLSPFLAGVTNKEQF